MKTSKNRGCQKHVWPKQISQLQKKRSQTKNLGAGAELRCTVLAQELGHLIKIRQPRSSGQYQRSGVAQHDPTNAPSTSSPSDRILMRSDGSVLNQRSTLRK
jgi:hypothetical protein